MTRVYIALGTNMNRVASLSHAVRRLGEAIKDAKYSRVYLSQPRNNARGPELFNAVMSGDTGLQLMELRDFTKTVEAEMGRQNWISPAGETFSLRCLDLDILTYGDTVSQTPELPRSDLIKYPFVIRPVLELCPDFMMPGRGRYLRDLVSLEGMEILDTVPELDLAALAGPASGRIGDFPGAGGSTLPRPALTQI